MDRNICNEANKDGIAESPPARVAWIETRHKKHSLYVMKSPPARVAWIETNDNTAPAPEQAVATREGGVDRNSLNLAGCRKT